MPKAFFWHGLLLSEVTFFECLLSVSADTPARPWGRGCQGPNRDLRPQSGVAPPVVWIMTAVRPYGRLLQRPRGGRKCFKSHGDCGTGLAQERVRTNHRRTSPRFPTESPADWFWGPTRLPLSSLTYSWNLFSKFFAIFPHGAFVCYRFHGHI